MTAFTTTTTNYPQNANTAIRRVIGIGPPTSTKNFILGDEYLDRSEAPHGKWWKVSNLATGGLVWVTVGGGIGDVQTLTANSGGPVGVDASSNINVVGDGTTIDIVGNPGTNTLTASATGSIATTYTEDAGSAIPSLGNLNILGTGGITTSGAGSTVTIDTDGTVATTYIEDSGSATPSLGSLNIFGAGGIATSGAGATVTIDTDGTIATKYNEDSGSAIPALGQLDILGSGGISTSGAGSTVTISSNGTIATQYDCDSGSATPALGVLNVLGLNDIATIGSGNTISIRSSTSFGFFTPTITGSTIPGVTTYVNQNGFYARMGNLVFAQLSIDWTATTGTGDIIMEGWPYKFGGGIARAPLCTVWIENMTWPAGVTYFIGFGQDNTKQMVFEGNKDSAASQHLQMQALGNIDVTIVYFTSDPF